MSTNDIKILTDLNEIEQLPELMLSPHFGMNYFVDFSDWTNGLIGATRIQIHAINSHFDRKHISEYFELLFQCHIKGTRYTYTAELKSPARCHIFMEAFLHQFLDLSSFWASQQRPVFLDPKSFCYPVYENNFCNKIHLFKA